MGRGKPLTDYEKGIIHANSAAGMSNRQIAISINRSLNVVNNYVNNPLHYGKKKSSGRPSLLSDRDKRNIVRKASNAVTSCSTIKRELDLNASAETVRRVLKKSKFIKHRKMKKAPFLTAGHREKRLEFARKNARTDWRKIVRMGETAASVHEDADEKIIKQLEYYFGNINLPRDKFLQEKLKEDDGWVPITTMLNFNRLAAICKDTEKIATAVKNSGSEIVSISEDNTKIRRNAENPVPENSLEYWQKIKHRTVYMKGFKTETQLDEIIQWANQFGETENVLMRRLKPGDRTFKGSVFITYKTREEAEAAQKSDAKFGETELIKMMQEEYWILKNKETKEARAANKAAKSAKNTAEAVESEKAQNAVRFEKGLILAIDGLSTDSTVDSIKTFFKQYGSVGYVAHENGSKTAEIRFNNDSEGGAQKAWDKASEVGSDGKVVLQGAELNGRVLEGEEEEKYWTEFNARKNQKQGGGGRGGRSHRGGRGGGRGRRGGDRRGEKRKANDSGDMPKAKHTVFEDENGDATVANGEE